MNLPLPRTLLLGLLTVLVVTLLPASAAQAQSVARYEDQARSVTNTKRDSHELRQLRRNSCVQRAARRQARRMANRDEMFHQDLSKVLRDCNLSSVGENVAAGYETGRAAVRAWMNSPGHRANILKPGYRLLGLAVRRADDGTPYAAQVFGRR